MRRARVRRLPRRQRERGAELADHVESPPPHLVRRLGSPEHQGHLSGARELRRSTPGPTTITAPVNAGSRPWLIASRPPGQAHHPPGAGKTVVLALMAAPLVVRRVWPIPVFGVMVAATIGVVWWDKHLLAWLAVLIALFTVAALRSRRAALVCAGPRQPGGWNVSARLRLDGGEAE